jgi:hypothetical protein
MDNNQFIGLLITMGALGVGCLALGALGAARDYWIGVGRRS